MQAIKILALAVAVAALPSPSVVEMTPEMTFVPRAMTVMAGEVVVWKNVAREPHTVNTVEANCRTEDGKKWIKMPAGATPFFSGEVKPGDEFRVRFHVPGTYQYLCTFHEHATMRGTIVVEGADR